jgi:hypothetical protein
MRRLVIQLLLAVVLPLLSTAHAQPDEAPQADGCDRLAKRYELDRTPNTALDLAGCAERSGDAERAWRLYDAAAKAYERTHQTMHARFARERADALVAQHPGFAELVTEPPIVAPEQGDEPVPAPTATSNRGSRQRWILLIAGLGVLGGSALVGVEAYSARSRTYIAFAASGSAVGVAMLGYAAFMPAPVASGSRGVSKRSVALIPVIAPSAAGALLHVNW